MRVNNYWYEKWKRLSDELESLRNRGGYGRIRRCNLMIDMIYAYKMFTAIEYIPSIYTDEENKEILDFANDNKILINPPCLKHNTSYFEKLLNKIKKPLTND